MNETKPKRRYINKKFHIIWMLDRIGWDGYLRVVWDIEHFLGLIKSMIMTKCEVVHRDWFCKNNREEILLKIHWSSFLPKGKLPGGKASAGQELVWVNQTLHHLLSTEPNWIIVSNMLSRKRQRNLNWNQFYIYFLPDQATLFPLLGNSFPY